MQITTTTTTTKTTFLSETLILFENIQMPFAIHMNSQSR